MNAQAILAAAPQSPCAATYSTELKFWLNGRPVTIANPDPGMTLVDYLHGMGLTGTKVGCGQGGCGACTVMLTSREADGQIRRTARSMPACGRCARSTA